MRRMLSSSGRSSGAPPGSERLKQRLSLTPGLSLLSSDASGDDGFLAAVEALQSERVFHRTAKATYNFYATVSITKSPAKRDSWPLRKNPSLASGKEKTIFDEPSQTEAYYAEDANGKIDRGPPAEVDDPLREGGVHILRQGGQEGEIEEGRKVQPGGGGEGRLDNNDTEEEATNFPDESAIGDDCLGSLSDKQHVVRGNLVSYAGGEGALRSPELPVDLRPTSISSEHAAAVIPLEVIAALKIQTIWRGWLQRNDFKQVKDSVVRLQSMVRGNRQFNNYRRILQAVVAIQKNWRQARSVKFVKHLKIERESREQQRVDNAAVVVQKHWRARQSRLLAMHLQIQRTLLEQRNVDNAAITMQKFWRALQSKRLVEHLRMERVVREQERRVAALKEEQNLAALVLQKHWRAMLSRRSLKQLKMEEAVRMEKTLDNFATVLQKYFRARQSRRLVKQMKLEKAAWQQKTMDNAAIVFQRCWRGQQSRLLVKHLQMERALRKQAIHSDAAVVLQRIWRGQRSKRLVKHMKVERAVSNQKTCHDAAIVLQKCWRGRQSRRAVNRLRVECARREEIITQGAAIVLQKHWRGQLSRHLIKRLKMEQALKEQTALHSAAVVLQAFWRGHQSRSMVERMEVERARRAQQEIENSAIVFQKYWRGRQSRSMVSDLRMQMLKREQNRREKAAIEFQRCWRGKQGRRTFKHVEMEQARRRHQEIENAALVFQGHWRGRHSRLMVNNLKMKMIREEQKRLAKAAMELQRYWRGQQGRCTAKNLKMDQACKRRQVIENAALVLQTHWRGRQSRQIVNDLKMQMLVDEQKGLENATIEFQRYWRGKQGRRTAKHVEMEQARRRQQEIENAALVFQTYWRVRREKQKMKSATIAFQSYWRGRQSRLMAKLLKMERAHREQQEINNAVIVFQKHWQGQNSRRMCQNMRMERARREQQEFDNAAVVFQKYWRGQYGRRTYKHMKMERNRREQEHRINMAAVVFQKHWRARQCSVLANLLKMNQHVKEQQRLHVAAVVLQKHWQSLQTRRRVICMKTERTMAQREGNDAAIAIQKAWRQFQSARCAVLPVTRAGRAMELGCTSNEMLAVDSDMFSNESTPPYMLDTAYSSVLEGPDSGSTACLVAHDVDDQITDLMFFDSLDALENLPCASNPSAQKRDRDAVLVQSGDLLATLDGEERKGAEEDWNYVPVDQLDECLDTCLATLKPLPLTLSTSSVSEHWVTVLDVSARANLLDSPEEPIKSISSDRKPSGHPESSISGQQICQEAPSTCWDVDESGNNDTPMRLEPGTSGAHASGSVAPAAQTSATNCSNVSQLPQQAAVQQHASHQQPRTSRQSEERLKHFAQVFLLQRHIALQQQRAQAAPPFPLPMQSGSGTSGPFATSLQDTGDGISSSMSIDRGQDVVESTAVAKDGNPSDSTGQIARHVDILPVDEAMASNQHHGTCEIVDPNDQQQPAVKNLPRAGQSSSAAPLEKAVAQPDVVLDMVLLLQRMEEYRTSEADLEDEGSTCYSRYHDIEEGLPLLDRGSGLRESNSLTSFTNSIGGMKRIGIPDVNAVLLVFIAMVVYTKAVCRGVVFGIRKTHRGP